MRQSRIAPKRRLLTTALLFALAPPLAAQAGTENPDDPTLHRR